MNDNAELKAMLDYLNTYGGRRGKFYTDLHGIKYSQDASSLGMSVSIPEEAIKQLYTTYLRIGQLVRDGKIEEDCRHAWIQEHLEDPLLEMHLAAVAKGRKLDSEKERA